MPPPDLPSMPPLTFAEGPNAAKQRRGAAGAHRTPVDVAGVPRAYDLHAGGMLRKPIVDPTEPDEAMRGYPLTRATTENGRWEYTLYDGGAHTLSSTPSIPSVGRRCASISTCSTGIRTSATSASGPSRAGRSRSTTAVHRPRDPPRHVASTPAVTGARAGEPARAARPRRPDRPDGVPRTGHRRERGCTGTRPPDRLARAVRGRRWEPRCARCPRARRGRPSRPRFNDSSRPQAARRK
jgi:hypothetical protein